MERKQKLKDSKFILYYYLLSIGSREELSLSELDLVIVLMYDEDIRECMDLVERIIDIDSEELNK